MPQSTTHLYLKMNKNKFTIKTGDNRYEYRINQLRANAWNNANIHLWKKILSKHDELLVDEDIDEKEEMQVESSSEYQKDFYDEEIEIDDDYCSIDEPKKYFQEDGLEFKGKKELYKHYNIKYAPKCYKIIYRKPYENGKRIRVYKLVKDESNNNCGEQV